MKTLEKQISKVLKDNGYYLNTELTALGDIIDYIDMVNEAYPDEYYSPEDWLRDTKINFPEYLLKEDELKQKYYEPILSYLATQRELCIDQTGCEPCFYDYECGMDCDEYTDMLKDHELCPDICKVTLVDLFNYLLDYWNKH